jgi:hypothetical protein
MVIFLEDIDRNKDKTCLTEVSTLLDELKDLDCLTFVLAIGDPSDTDSTLRRVCEHIDNMPQPDRQSLLNLIVKFRKHCLSDVNQSLRFVPDEDMDERLGIKRSYRTQIQDQLVNVSKKPIDYLIDLLANPRNFKTVLRRTHNAWRSLKGEINLDDLLVANAIRMEAPEVFAYINTNISQFFWLQLESDAPTPASKLDPVMSQWKNMKDNPRWEAATKLAEHLFPQLVGARTPDQYKIYQSVGYDRFFVPSGPYWTRLLREALLPNEIPDTEVLIAIHEWNQDPKSPSFRDMEMQKALLSEELLCSRLIYFKDLIDEHTLLSVLETQIEQTLNEKGSKANRENCPALGRWFQMVPDRLREGDHWISWIEEKISHAIPKSLRYAFDLLQFEVAAVKALSLTTNLSQLFAVTIKRLQDNFQDKPKALIDSLDSEKPKTLRWLLQLLTDSQNGGKGLESEDWKWLASTLLQAGEHNAEVIVPQLAVLLTNDNQEQLPNGSRHYTAIFNDNISNNLPTIIRSNYQTEAGTTPLYSMIISAITYLPMKLRD